MLAPPGPDAATGRRPSLAAHSRPYIQLPCATDTHPSCPPRCSAGYSGRSTRCRTLSPPGTWHRCNRRRWCADIQRRASAISMSSNGACCGGGRTTRTGRARSTCAPMRWGTGSSAAPLRVGAPSCRPARFRTRPTGRYGWARSRAIRHRCYARHRTEPCARGQWVGGWTARRTMGQSCYAQVPSRREAAATARPRRQRVPDLPCL